MTFLALFFTFENRLMSLIHEYLDMGDRISAHTVSKDVEVIEKNANEEFKAFLFKLFVE